MYPVYSVSWYGMFMIVSQKDYEDVYRVITHVLKRTKTPEGQSMDLSNNCHMFARIGSQILEKYFNVIAKPLVCRAIFHLTPDITLAFDDEETHDNDDEEPNRHAVVMAIKKRRWFYIDFSAPNYSDLLADDGYECPVKMFQRPVNESKPDKDKLKRVGDFFIAPDWDLTDCQDIQFLFMPNCLSLIDECVNDFPNLKINTTPVVNKKFTGAW